MRRPGPPTVTEAAILNWRESAWAGTPLAGREQRTTDGRPSGPPNGRLWARHSPALGERNQSAIESSSPVVAAKLCARLKRAAPRARGTKRGELSLGAKASGTRERCGAFSARSDHWLCGRAAPPERRAGPQAGLGEKEAWPVRGALVTGGSGRSQLPPPTRRVQMRCAVRSCRGG